MRQAVKNGQYEARRVDSSSSSSTSSSSASSTSSSSDSTSSSSRSSRDSDTDYSSSWSSRDSDTDDSSTTSSRAMSKASAAPPQPSSNVVAAAQDPRPRPSPKTSTTSRRRIERVSAVAQQSESVASSPAVRRLRGTDSRVHVRSRLRALSALHKSVSAEPFCTDLSGSCASQEEAEATLQSRLEVLTREWLAREAQAGLTPRTTAPREGFMSSTVNVGTITDITAADHCAEGFFYIRLDGFSAAVNKASPYVCPRALFQGPETDAWPRVGGVRRADSSLPNSAATSSPVLLFDCTIPICRQRARHQLQQEVDEAFTHAASALAKVRRDVEACRSCLRRRQRHRHAGSSITAAADAKTTDVQSTEQARQSSSPSTLPVVMRAESEECELDESLFCSRPERKRKRIAKDRPPLAVWAPRGEEVTLAPSAQPLRVDTAETTHQRLVELREELSRLDAMRYALSFQYRHVHRTEWLSGSGSGLPEVDMLNDAESGGVLLLPHPDTGLVKVEAGHHYRLVKFIGSHLVLAGHWEPIPLAPLDQESFHHAHSASTTAARVLDRVDSDVAPPREPAETDGAQQDYWVRREMAAVLLFLRDHTDRTVTDFFALTPEEAAVYVTAAAEKGWSRR